MRRWEEAHRAAVERGEHAYRDPATGYVVMTELSHLARGNCCGNGCRHCPYAHAKVAPEHRDLLAPPFVIQRA